MSFLTLIYSVQSPAFNWACFILSYCIPSTFSLQYYSGHEAPVVSLSFSPVSSLLASGSWDHTVTFWKIGEEKGARESVDVGHDGEKVKLFTPEVVCVVCATENYVWKINYCRYVAHIQGDNLEK